MYRNLPSPVANLLKKIAKKTNLVFISHERFSKFIDYERLYKSSRLCLLLKPEICCKCLVLANDDKSQFGQALMALAINSFKRNGFYVEFGATNGLELSNTYLLERSYGWRGILAEPAKCWHSELSLNRKNAVIDHRCVYSVSGRKLMFNEARGLSTINGYGKDHLYSMRRFSKSYRVETVSLTDLLEKGGAPKLIDFISIDTEGSEVEIIMAHDFDKYAFNFIVVEHNFGSGRERLNVFLKERGYVRLIKNYSGCDDYFVNERIVDSVKNMFSIPVEELFD